MQNKLNDRFPSCLFHCCFPTFRPRPLHREPLRFVFVYAATMLKSYTFNPLWTMNTTIFQETWQLNHILESIIGRLFQRIILRRPIRSSFIDSFSFAKKHCNTSQGFGAFFFQSCDRLFFLFFFSPRFFSRFFLFFYGN